MPARVSPVRGADARLWSSGTRAVRTMWITRVWVHMDATNHPVWNRAAHASRAAGSVSWVYSLPPADAGQNTKYISRKTAMSNTELTGPFHSMNRRMPPASQRQGARRYSASTLSQEMAVQDRSYTRFSKISCRAVMGKKGRNALAASTDSMLPKLEDTVILMYFIMLA